MAKDYIHIKPITESNSKYFKHILLNNISIINKYFFASSIKLDDEKYFSKLYNDEILVDNEIAKRYKHICGIVYDHMPIPLSKSIFFDVWKKEEQYLNEVCCRKIRDYYRDVNIFLMRNFQLLSGKFIPYNRCRGKYMRVTDAFEDLDKNIDIKNKIICINDSDENVNYKEKIKFIHNKLDKILGEKSSFEL